MNLVFGPQAHRLRAFLLLTLFPALHPSIYQLSDSRAHLPGLLQRCMLGGGQINTDQHRFLPGYGRGGLMAQTLTGKIYE